MYFVTICWWARDVKHKLFYTVCIKDYDLQAKSHIISEKNIKEGQKDVLMII